MRISFGFLAAVMAACVALTSVPGAATDSTQSIPPKVGWKKPSASHAETADTATKADSATKATTADSASTANTAGALITLPNCTASQVLTVSNGGLTCVTASGGSSSSSC